MNRNLTPKQYLIQNARNLPYHQVLINPDWQVNGMARIVVVKRMPSGKFIPGVFLLDTFCMGLKNCFWKFAISEIEIRELIAKTFHDCIPVESDPSFINNLIYGAIDYAEENGFAPQRDFREAEYLLNPDLIDGQIDQIVFGKNGMPHYIPGPDDQTEANLKRLEARLGKGNFYFTIPSDES